MKKIKLFALAAFAMLSTNAFAQADLHQRFTVNDVTYQVTEAYAEATGFENAKGQVTVVAYAQTESTDPVAIPETISNKTADLVAVPTTNVYKVTAIANYNTKVNGADAFDASTVKVFRGAKASKIILPFYIVSIGKQAFENCEATEITIPEHSFLTTIGQQAFKGAKNLATFATTNADIVSIGANAFEGCAKLTSISLGAKLTTIGNEAFKGTGITTLNLSACSKLWKVADTPAIDRLFTDDVDDPTTYNTNDKLTTVVLPTAIEETATAFEIAANAFKGCTALTTVATSATASAAVMPAYVSKIGAGAFLNTGITKFDLSANAKIKEFAAWFSINPGAPAPDPSKLTQVILNKAFDGSTADKTYTIGTTLANISTLAKIGIVDSGYKLPAGATLAEGMFAGTALTQLDMTAGVKVATDNTLDALFGANGISTLTTVALPQALTKLAAKAFYNCTALETLSVKDKTDLSTIVSVGNGAFYRTKLATLKFGAALTTLTTPFLGTLTAPGTTDLLPFSTAESISIDLSAAPNEFTALADNTFQKLAQLTSIKLPSKLQTIGANAFEGTGITTIELPKTITQAAAHGGGLGANAFKDCKSLTSVSYQPETGSNITIFAYDGNDAGDDAAKNVFKGCNLVNFATTNEYALNFGSGKTYPVPVNVVMAQAATKTIKTKLDKKTKGYAMKGFYDENNNYKIKISDVTTVYEAYLNDGDVVLSRLKKIGQYYEIPAGLAVIVRTSEEKAVEPIKIAAGELTTANGSSLLTIAGNALKSVDADNSDKPEANYIYALTNKDGEGFAFSFYTGTKFNNGHIYVISPKAPTASGRLNIVFLDEDGNVEDEATAIQSIEKKAENNGVRYNLAGQKVSASYKGVVIKDGKKYIQK